MISSNRPNHGEYNKIKSTTTKEKIDTFTNAITTLFSEETKPEFDEEYKIMVDQVITDQQNNLKPLKQIPINYLTSALSIKKEKIINTASKLNSKKALGPDKISNKIIKYLIIHLITLGNLFNVCWHKGYYPQEWKKPISLLLNKPFKTATNPLEKITSKDSHKLHFKPKIASASAHHFSWMSKKPLIRFGIMG